MLAGGDERRDPGADTTFDSSADARGELVDVALRFNSGRVTTAVAADVTPGDETGY